MTKDKWLPIDDDVPITPPMRLGKPGCKKPDKYIPWSRMEIGQSCFIPATVYHRVAVMYNARHACIRTGKYFAARTRVENGVEGTRIWRVN